MISAALDHLSRLVAPPGLMLPAGRRDLERASRACIRAICSVTSADQLSQSCTRDHRYTAPRTFISKPLDNRMKSLRVSHPPPHGINIHIHSERHTAAMHSAQMFINTCYSKPMLLRDLLSTKWLFCIE